MKNILIPGGLDQQQRVRIHQKLRNRNAKKIGMLYEIPEDAKEIKDTIELEEFTNKRLLSQEQIDWDKEDKFWKIIRSLCVIMNDFNSGLRMNVDIMDLSSQTFNRLSNNAKIIDYCTEHYIDFYPHEKDTVKKLMEMFKIELD